jgi:dephospho-CoA kinase
MIKLDDLNIIGLTGMSGAGKTLASKAFSEAGFCVIDCDKGAKLTISRKPCAGEVLRAFPEAYTNGEFDRVKMARIVFKDTEKLKHYESIVFPHIISDITNYIRHKAGGGETRFLLDAPTLYQSGADYLCREIVAVIADKETCVKRITARDKISETDALLRLNAQPGADFFREKADYIIENNGDKESFSKAVKAIIRGLK